MPIRFSRLLAATAVTLLFGLNQSWAGGHHASSGQGIAASVEGIGLDDTLDSISDLKNFVKSPNVDGESFVSLNPPCGVVAIDSRVFCITGQKALFYGKTVNAGQTETECKRILGAPVEEGYSQFPSVDADKEKGLLYGGANGVLVVKLRRRGVWRVDSFILARASFWEDYKGYLSGQ